MVYNAEKGPPTLFAKVELCEFQAGFFVLNVCRTGLKTEWKEQDKMDQQH